MKNMKTFVKLALKTNSRNARANKDLRSLVQSVVISSIQFAQRKFGKAFCLVASLLVAVRGAT